LYRTITIRLTSFVLVWALVINLSSGCTLQSRDPAARSEESGEGVRVVVSAPPWAPRTLDPGAVARLLSALDGLQRVTEQSPPSSEVWTIEAEIVRPDDKHSHLVVQGRHVWVDGEEHSDLLSREEREVGKIFEAALFGEGSIAELITRADSVVLRSGDVCGFADELGRTEVKALARAAEDAVYNAPGLTPSEPHMIVQPTPVPDYSLELLVEGTLVYLRFFGDSSESEFGVTWTAGGYMQAFFAQSSERLWHEMAKLRPLGLKDAARAHPLGLLLAAEHLEVRGGAMDQPLVVPPVRVLGIARVLLNAHPEATGEFEVIPNPYRLIFRVESTAGIVEEEVELHPNHVTFRDQSYPLENAERRVMTSIHAG
jgi:hypothetical protein